MLSIYAAVEIGSVEAVREALESGADVNTTVSKARKLASQRTMVEDDTALHLACETNNYTMARLLVEHGADVNCRRTESPLKSIKDTQGERSRRMTPLQVVVQQGNDDGERLTKLLAINGADVRPLLRKGKAGKSKYINLSFFVANSLQRVMVKKLEVLDLSRCQLDVLPASIVTRNGRVNESLLHLTELNLSHNKLKELPHEIAHLKHLRVLRVNHNLLEKLPTSLVRLKGVLTKLKADDNPIRVPPKHVVAKGTRAMLDFLNDVLEGTVEPQLALKLVVVGQENVGKTSLRRSIAQVYKKSFRGTLSNPSIKQEGDEAPVSLTMLMECTDLHKSASGPLMHPERIHKANSNSSIKWRKSLANLNSWASLSRKNVKVPASESAPAQATDIEGLSTDGIDISTITIPVKMKISSVQPATTLKLRQRKRSLSTQDISPKSVRAKKRLSRVAEVARDDSPSRPRANTGSSTYLDISSAVAESNETPPERISPRGLVRYSPALDRGMRRSSLSIQSDGAQRPRTSTGSSPTKLLSDSEVVEVAVKEEEDAKEDDSLSLSREGTDTEDDTSTPRERMASASLSLADAVDSVPSRSSSDSPFSLSEHAVTLGENRMSSSPQLSKSVSAMQSVKPLADDDQQSYVAPNRREMLTKLFSLDLDALFEKMRSPTTGIVLRSYKHKFKKLKDCCSGELVVGWLVMHCEAVSSRSEAEVVGELLLRKGYIRSANKSAQFRDSAQTFYMLVGLELQETSVTFHVYDFGGQEVYYPTHQFFLTKNSLYVVVFDMTKPLHASRVGYWLEAIYSRASSSSNIIIVGTHADCALHDGKTAIEILTDVEKEFYQRYRTIKGVIAVSSEDGQGIEELCSLLKTVALKFVESLPLVPVKVRYIERALAQEAEKNSMLPVLGWKEVQKVGELYQIFSRDQLRSVVQYLHETGRVLFHHSSPSNLQQRLVCQSPSRQGGANDDVMAKLEGSYIILNPQWMARCMSSIVTTKSNFIVQGVLSRSTLEHIWHHTSEFPKHVHDFLLALLQSFEIVYRLGTAGVFTSNVKSDDDGPSSPVALKPQEQFLVPCLLPERSQLPPEWAEPSACAKFNRLFQFKFLPHGLFSRLLVQVMSLADEVVSYWRNGVVVILGRAKVAIVQDLEQRRILLEVRNIEASHLPGRKADDVVEKLESSWAASGQAVIKALDALCSFWFCVHVTKFIACPHCLAGPPSRALLDVNVDFDAIHLFPMSACEVAVLRGEEQQICPLDGSRTPLDMADLAPNVSLTTTEASLIAPDNIAFTGRSLGKGAFGSVEEAVVGGYGRCAIKQFGSANFQEFASDIRRELMLMGQVSHPNIVNLLGYCVKPLQLVMELVPLGDLHTYLHGREELSWPLRIRIALDACRGMVFLHSATPPIVHRDFKTPNILLVDQSPVAPITAKVSDFGLSMSLYTGTLKETADTRDVHTPYWLAPEIIREQEYTEKVDVYAFGIVLWELLTRENPFEEFKKKFGWQVEQLILEGTRPTIPDLYLAGSDAPPQVRLRKRKEKIVQQEEQRNRQSVGELKQVHMQKIALAAKVKSSAELSPASTPVREDKEEKEEKPWVKAVPALPLPDLSSMRLESGSDGDVNVSEVELGRQYVALMRECWDDSPDVRPSFAAILPRLERLLESSLEE